MGRNKSILGFDVLAILKKTLLAKGHGHIHREDSVLNPESAALFHVRVDQTSSAYNLHNRTSRSPHPGNTSIIIYRIRTKSAPWNQATTTTGEWRKIPSVGSCWIKRQQRFGSQPALHLAGQTCPWFQWKPPGIGFVWCPHHQQQRQLTGGFGWGKQKSSLSEGSLI